MKLTSTNSSIGLIATVMKVEIGFLHKHDKQIVSIFGSVPQDCEARWPGDYSADVPPDPIPNSNVKLCCADGTAS